MRSGVPGRHANRNRAADAFRTSVYKRPRDDADFMGLIGSSVRSTSGTMDKTSYVSPVIAGGRGGPASILTNAILLSSAVMIFALPVVFSSCAAHVNGAIPEIPISPPFSAFIMMHDRRLARREAISHRAKIAPQR